LRANGAILGAAKGFDIGQLVIVLKKDDVYKVIGHVSGIKQCSDDEFNQNYYIFYRDGGTLKIANCKYESGITVTDTKDYDDAYTDNFTSPVTFHLKKFYHAVPSGSTTVTRSLYFVATSLYIDPAPFLGWTNFAAANPAFPLVTNNGNTRITVTPQLLSDLGIVNARVNTEFTYVSDPAGNDNWRVMSAPDSGDCEDFALTKVSQLLDLGYAASALHVETGQIDGSAIGHAWLVVQTSEGDYALDTGVDSIQVNSSLKPTPTTEYTARRRQIGSNWAFTSPYGWMLSSSNQTFPYLCWYILDPLLNIFYELNPGMTNLYPFTYIRTDPSILSGPSINFSTTAIHVADGIGGIKSYHLHENSLDVVSTSSYTSGGFIGTDGLIVEPVGLTGNQDIRIGRLGTTSLFSGLWYVDFIEPLKLGDHTILSGIDVISVDGHFDYTYVYAYFSLIDTVDGLFRTFELIAQDTAIPSDPDKYYDFTKSIIEYEPDEFGDPTTSVHDVVNEDCVAYNASRYPSWIGKTSANQIHVDYLLTDPLIYPDTEPYNVDRQDAMIHIPYGDEAIDFYGDNYPVYGNYYPYFWNYMEVGPTSLIQGLRIQRGFAAPDNLVRMYKDGVDCLSVIAAAVGVSTDNVLGITNIPCADRLN
jgi:predicted transglutaminase-like cysteine proteinase